MALSFTPNIGLTKFTDTELASNFVNGTQIESDNNVLIQDFMDVNLVQYTPAVIAATSNPNFGAGQVSAEYTKYGGVGGVIMGSFVLVALDPAVAPGSGTGAYGISLPELADNSFHILGTTLADVPGTAHCVGEGYMSDASSLTTCGSVGFDIVRISGVDYLRPITELFAGKTTRWLGPTVPFSLATGDKIAGNFVYKAAN